MIFRPSRRDLFKLASTVAVGSALRAFRAEAQQQAIPKRLVLFFTPHGTVFEKWRPTGAGTDFQLSYILQPLQAFKSKLVVLDGVGLPSDGPGAPHTRGPAVLFTGSPLADDGTFKRDDCSGGCTFGWNTYHSVDQEVAQRLGTVTPYSSLEFGVRSGGGFPGAHISYAAPAKPMPPKQDPYIAFQQLFAGQTQTDAQRAKILTRRLSVMSAVKGDLTALQSRLGASDRQQLDAHAQAIADLERSLKAPVACQAPPAPESRTSNSAGFRPWAVDRQIELLAASLACGLTRVASLQFRPGENDGGSEGIYDWLGQSQEHHLSTHDTSTDSVDRVTEIYKWYASRFAYLLQKLDSIPEADGTMLDHTMVVWGSEIGVGNVHSIDNIPFVIAGGGKAGVKTGQYLKTSAMNHRLLVSMCHFMGYTDVTRYGTVDKGSGPLPGLLG